MRVKQLLKGRTAVFRLVISVWYLQLRGSVHDDHACSTNVGGKQYRIANLC